MLCYCYCSRPATQVLYSLIRSAMIQKNIFPQHYSQDVLAALVIFRQRLGARHTATLIPLFSNLGYWVECVYNRCKATSHRVECVYNTSRATSHRVECVYNRCRATSHRVECVYNRCRANSHRVECVYNRCRATSQSGVCLQQICNYLSLQGVVCLHRL